jgi:hypothetical protein
MSQASCVIGDDNMLVVDSRVAADNANLMPCIKNVFQIHNTLGMSFVVS